MFESGFTSCEDELLENVTASLVSSAYTDDGGTWKSSSGSTVESLTKCEDLDLEVNERSSSPRGSGQTSGSPQTSPRLGHKPPRWATPRDCPPSGGPDSLSPREPLSPRAPNKPFRRSGIPVHSTPAPTRLLTKCQSLQDLSKCLALLHTDRLNNTYNSTDTINSQSLSSTKDSGFQRSYSSNSICSVRRRNKYDHVESKVRQYIRNIKDNERRHKELKRNSLHSGTQEEATPRRSSLLVTDAELLDNCPSRGSKSCCNTRRNSYQDELRVLFNIDDESNKALTSLIKKLEVEKLERDLVIEDLQVKYHELSNKLSNANETISDLKKQQVTLPPLATSIECGVHEPLPYTCKPRPERTRRHSDRSHHHIHHHLRRRLSPVQSLSSQASRSKVPADSKAPASSRSSQNSHRPAAAAPQPPCRKKLNLPRDDPILKVQRWQDSLSGVESSSATSCPVTPCYNLAKSSTVAFLPSDTESPVPSQVPNYPESSRTCFRAFDSNFHLGRSKTSPDIKRSTVYINIGDHSGEHSLSSKKSKHESSSHLDVNSNLCPLAENATMEPQPVKQITVLNIFEAEDGTKVVEDITKEVNKRRGSFGNILDSPSTAKVHVTNRPSPSHVTQTKETPLQSPRPYGLSQSRTTPNMKRVSINLASELKNSTGSSDSLSTTTDDEKPLKRPPSVPPNTRWFKELSSLQSCLNEVDEQIHQLKHGVDHLIKSTSQKSVHSFLEQP